MHYIERSAIEMVKQDYERILAYVRAKKETLTEELRGLVQIPSVLGKAEPGAPYGRECARMLEAVKTLFAAHGLKSEIFPESGYLIADTGEGKRSLGVFSHSDVVAVDNNWTLSEPFEGRVRDGFMIGRGCGDNKSGIIASLYAVLALRDLEIPCGSRIRLVVGSCEENNMPDMIRYTKEQEIPDVSVIPDMVYPVGRGEKGSLRIWAVSRKRFTAIKDFNGGKTPNVTLGQAHVRLANSPALEKAFGSLGEPFAFENDKDDLVITATGASKHSAWPEGSVNAAKLLCGVLAECPHLPEGDRDILNFASKILEGCYGEGFDITGEDPDLGRLTCTNGLARLRDGRLALSFNVRYGPAVNGDTVIERIIRTLENGDFDLEVESRMDGFIIPRDDRILNVLLDCYSEITGEKSPEPFLANSGTYARVIPRAYSIAPYVSYKNPFNLPVGHGGAHQPDEVICIDGIIEGAARLAAMLLSLDRAE